MRRSFAIGLVLTPAVAFVAAAANAAPSTAADRPPTDLWSTYPLYPAPTTRTAPAPAAGPARPGNTSRSRSTGGGGVDLGDPAPLAGAAAAGVLVLAAITLVVVRVARGASRRGRTPELAAPSPPPLAPAAVEGQRLLTAVSIAAPVAEPPRLTPPRPDDPQPVEPEPPQTEAVVPEVAEPEEVAAPAAEPVPAEAEEEMAPQEELCEVRWWRGYVRSRFYAEVEAPEGYSILAESPMFRWRGQDPPAQEGEVAAAHDALVGELMRLGWVIDEPGPDDEPALWYEIRLRRAADAAEEEL
jgi:hypothetical protein